MMGNNNQWVLADQMNWSTENYKLEYLFTRVSSKPQVLTAAEGYYGSVTETISAGDLMYAYQARRQCRVVLQTDQRTSYSFPVTFPALFTVEHLPKLKLKLNEILRRTVSKKWSWKLPMNIRLCQTKGNVDLYKSLVQQADSPSPGEPLTVAKIYDAKFFICLNIIHDCVNLVDSILPVHIDVSMRFAKEKVGSEFLSCLSQFIMSQLHDRDELLVQRPVNDFLDGVIELTYNKNINQISNTKLFRESSRSKKHGQPRHNESSKIAEENAHGFAPRQQCSTHLVKIDFKHIKEICSQLSVSEMARKSLRLYSDIVSVHEYKALSSILTPETTESYQQDEKQFIAPDHSITPLQLPPRNQLQSHPVTQLHHAVGESSTDYFGLIDDFDLASTAALTEPAQGARVQQHAANSESQKVAPQHADHHTSVQDKVHAELRSRLVRERAAPELPTTDSGASDWQAWTSLPTTSPRDDQTSVTSESLTIRGVHQLLEELNLHTYSEQFKSNLVDGKLLAELEKHELTEDFGMTAIEAKRLWMAVREGWRPKI